MRVLRHFGVFFPELKALAVSDLQLGYEEVLHSRGIEVPCSQYGIIVRRISRMLEETRAKKIILLGDLKHGFSKASRQEWGEVVDILNFLKKKKLEIILVRGNHDNYVKKILGAQDLQLRQNYLGKGFLFVHGHQALEEQRNYPEIRGYRTLVMGHVHPSVSVRDDVGVRHKYPCLLKGVYRGKPLLVLPSVSPLAAGVDFAAPDFNGEHFSPILGECNLLEFVPVLIDERAGARQFPKIKHL